MWLVMTTGMRRGEVCALRWARVDLEAGIVDVRRSYRLRYGVGTEKDTKTHQMRRIALDNESVVLLTEHKRRCSQRLRDLGMELTDDMYVFSSARKFEPTSPCSPHSVSSRYRNLARRLGIDTHIHALRHYSATELRPVLISAQSPGGSVTGVGEPRPCVYTRRGLRRPTVRRPRFWAPVCRSDRQCRRQTMDSALQVLARCQPGKRVGV